VSDDDGSVLILMQFRGDTVVPAVAVEDNTDDNISSYFLLRISTPICYALSTSSLCYCSSFNFEMKQFVDYFDSTPKTRGPHSPRFQKVINTPTISLLLYTRHLIIVNSICDFSTCPSPPFFQKDY
jgi:hypothetical protein